MKKFTLGIKKFHVSGQKREIYNIIRQDYRNRPYFFSYSLELTETFQNN